MANFKYILHKIQNISHMCLILTMHIMSCCIINLNKLIKLSNWLSFHSSLKDILNLGVGLIWKSVWSYGFPFNLSLKFFFLVLSKWNYTFFLWQIYSIFPTFNPLVPIFHGIFGIRFRFTIFGKVDTFLLLWGGDCNNLISQHKILSWFAGILVVLQTLHELNPAIT